MNKKLITSLLALTLSVSFTSNAEQASADEVKQQASAGCGVITLYNKPPATRNVHFASINSIDGQTVNMGAKAFTLSPGKHVIRVVEHIRENSITRRRGEAKNFHFIEFDVEANKKYSLGAKYIRKNRNKFTTGEYWAPEVWKTTDVECKA
jgi:hypothetical protein